MATIAYDASDCEIGDFHDPEFLALHIRRWGEQTGQRDLYMAYALPYAEEDGGDRMTTVNVTEARDKLYRLVDEAAQTHSPIVITARRGNAVLIAEEDWNAINETLYLLSVPGMRESIREGMQESLDECRKDPGW